MTQFPSPMPPDRNPQKKGANRPLIFGVLTAVLVLVLLIFVPGALIFFMVVGFIAALIGLFIGKLPIPGVTNRKRVAAVLGSTLVLLLMAVISLGLRLGTTDPAPAVAQPGTPAIAVTEESPTPTPSETMLADFLGRSCEDDELVMEQGSDKLFCDENAAKALIWTSSEDHNAAIAAAKEAEQKAEAERKATAEKKAAEKAAAEKKQAEQEAAAKKKAEEKAAAKKAAEKAAAQEAAEEAARLAEIEAEKEIYKAPAKAPSNTYYANCTAVRAAGAAPIYAGDPGYSRKLDRDGDGVGCE